MHHHECLFQARAGMAGLIVVMVVLGFMSMVSFSQSYIILSESQGARARENSKQAYLVAFSGVQYLISTLRKVSQTYTVSQQDDLYFCNDASTLTNHWQASTSTNIQYTGMTQLKTQTEFKCTSTFPNNLSSVPADSVFYLCSYPGGLGTYWVKCQGIHTVSGVPYKCQLWAELRIDYTGETVVLKRFGQMPVQTLVWTPNSGAPANDFWDWQAF